MPAERAWHIRAMARSLSLFVRDRSLDALKADDVLDRGGAALAASLRVVDDLRVGVEVGYAGGRFSDGLLGTYDTRLVHDTLEAGAWVGYRLWDSLTPYLRFGATVTWARATVRDETQRLGGRDVAAGGYALGGLELTMPRRWFWNAFGSTVFTLGLLVEGGYVDLGKLSVAGGLSQDGLVDEYRAALGSLRLRGAALNVGLVLSF